MNYLDELNPEQRKAVLATEGPVLIVAGAGAGKTKTITHRILHLIKNGVAPQNILAITFTNKAAKEMKERVDKLLSEDKEINFPVSTRERPFVSTFHSLGVHILKENCKLLGLPRHFAIFDKSDSKRAIKEAIESCNLDPKQYEPSKILNIISGQKGRQVNVEGYAEKIDNEYFAKIVLSVWQKYEAILRKEKALDFDDLLLKTCELLKNNEKILEHYNNVWKYIHIDEYQDTNRVQYIIGRLLAGSSKNICVVGDADQNIYSWRGAQIKNILDFEKDYPNAKVFLLEENYRSTQNILAVANKIIEKNKFRKEKRLFTKKEDGAKVGLFQAYDEADEANFIASKCEELIKQNVQANEIAVLYRANFQSRVLEEAFLSLAVPYQILGTKFFERKEVKDILSFIKASLNTESFSDMKRIINVPARGIGKVTFLKIIEGKENELPMATRKKVSDFKNFLAKIREKIYSEKPSEIIKFILFESGLENILKKGTDEDKERLENIRELVTLAVRYDGLPQEEGIEKLLTDAALASDQDEMIKDKPAVKLMTAHASKGLEFDFVFITGLEDDLFPHKKLDEGEIAGEEEEEERRLFYVAITRARKKLFLTYAGLRTIFGAKKVNLPSEFLMDIDDDFIEREEGYGFAGKKPIFRIDF